MESDRSVEDLAYLRKVSQSVHLSTLATGHYFVLWGSVIAAGMFYAWIEAQTSPPIPSWTVWIVLIASGWFVTSLIAARERRRSPTTSHSGRTLAMFWIGCGVSMTVAFFGGISAGAIPAQAVPGLTASFLALGILATGVLSGKRWLTSLALLWWVSAVALFYLPPDKSVLALAGCLLALFVVPGVVLHLRPRVPSPPLSHG